MKAKPFIPLLIGSMLCTTSLHADNNETKPNKTNWHTLFSLWLNLLKQRFVRKQTKQAWQ